MDLWKKKNRPHWQSDDKFMEFNKRLYNEYWTFEETYTICKIDELNLDENTLVDMKNKWTTLVIDWNEAEDIQYKDKAKGFVAITYMFIVIPYHKLEDIGKQFTEFDTNNISICYFYNNYSYIGFDGAEELFNSGPMYPPAYMEWLDRKFNQASWWLSYMVYEKMNNLEPIIDSKPAKLETKN